MAAYQFPSFYLVDGTEIRIEIASQQYQPSREDVGPIFDTPTALTGCPFLAPTPFSVEKNLGQDIGVIGVKRATLSFSGMAVNAGGDTLVDLLRSVDLDSFKWHVRISRKVGATWHIQFWGVLELADPDGSIVSFDAPEEFHTYSISAVDVLTQLEEVEMSTDWLDNFLPHATYDEPAGTASAAVYVTLTSDSSGDPASTVALDAIFAKDVLSSNYGWHSPGCMKFIRLRDIVYACSAVMGITNPINDGSASAVTTTWEVFYGGAAHEVGFDTLYVSSGVHVDWTEWYQEHGFFDADTGRTPVSIYRCSSLLDVLKFFLVPLGLTAAVAVNSSNEPYLAVYEHRRGDLSSPYNDMLTEISLEPGDLALYGLATAVANDKVQNVGQTNDRSIDVPYMGHRRILMTDPHFSWTAGGRRCGDSQCLHQGLYAKDPGNPTHFHAVHRVKVRNNTSGVSEVWNTPTGNAFSTDDGDRFGYGAMFGWACLRYYFNLDTEGTGTGPSGGSKGVGMGRRISNALTFKLAGLQWGLEPGYSYTSIHAALSGTWRITEVKLDPGEMATTVKVERGEFV